ncbi:MAG: hypothetical protein Q7W55_12700 [Pseudohongiella sp.]|nr:hypothetical protein [Pseudohongiella sp.]MDO9519967.1 hypothetical protein [Pseudohongiella sp.]MDP2127130.1 hypothetical protein [Pseudohongiella sp.]
MTRHSAKITAKSVLFFFAFCAATSSAADTQVNFAITPFSFNDTVYDELSLDITETPRFLQAHGALIATGAGAASPVTGTCFFTGEGGVFCTLKYSVFTFNLNLNADIQGSYAIIGAGGDTQATGQASLSAIN